MVFSIPRQIEAFAFTGEYSSGITTDADKIALLNETNTFDVDTYNRAIN